jgi:hypothetical protein
MAENQMPSNAELPTPDEPTFVVSVAESYDSTQWTRSKPMTRTEFLANVPDVFVAATFTGQHRRGEDLVDCTLLVLDEDDGRTFLQRIEILDDLGYAYAYWETKRSTPEAPRYRLVLWPSRTMTADEKYQVSKAFMQILDWGKDECGALAVQFMYGPGPRPVTAADGSVVDVDALLIAAKEMGIEPRRGAAVAAERWDGTPPTAQQLDKGETVLRKYMAQMEDPEAAGFAGRSDALISMLPTLLRFGLAGVLDADEVVEAMWEATESAPGDHPFERKEFDGVVGRAWRYAEADGAAVPFVITAAEEFDVFVEADPVFDATPVLAHIRQAAHSRMLSAPGLLLTTLARIAVEVPETTMLPPVVGGRASLNCGVALVGASAAGKSSQFDVSRELLGPVGEDQKWVERVPGSGEGLVDTYLDAPIKDPTTGQKSRPLIADPRRLFYVDEIGMLGAIKDGRSGSTIGPTLRSLLTGGPLGQENATIERRRYVPAGAYRAALVVGVQPTASDVLLNEYDVGVGTPQRLAWVLMADPTIPDEPVAWPGAIGWWPPSWPAEVAYPEHVQQTVRDAARARARGDAAEADELSGHALLTRLKVAALLAFLHDEVEISDQWWTLAGVIVNDWGGAALAACRRELTRAKEKQATAVGRMRGQTRLAEEQVVDEHAAKKQGVTDSLLKALEKAGEDGLAWSALRAKVHSPRRSIADALVGTPDAPGPLVTSGRLRLETVEYQGQRGFRVYAGTG